MSNSCSFKQALKALRERIENCERIAMEIKEKYRKGVTVQACLESQLASLEELIH